MKWLQVPEHYTCLPSPKAFSCSLQLIECQENNAPSRSDCCRMQPILTSQCVDLGAGLELVFEMQDNAQRLQEELEEAAHLAEHLQLELDKAESERQQVQDQLKTMQAMLQQAEVSSLDAFNSFLHPGADLQQAQHQAARLQALLQQAGSRYRNHRCIPLLCASQG